MVSDDDRDDEQPEDAPAQEETPSREATSSGPVTPVTAGQLLRTALVDDEDPRFPNWLPVPGAVLAVGWAGYQATAGDAGVLPTLGISVAIFAGTTLAAWLGWQLEID
jgi:hypothetical protein